MPFTPTLFPDLKTVYGSIKVEYPCIADLIASPAFQRLRLINQYGVVNFIFPTENYSRYDHSLGVYYLLQRIQASYEEQIAGLLHDISHTVFSHVGDYVFEDRYPGKSYQDDIHVWYLKESGIEEILQKHSLSSEVVDHNNAHFMALDQKLPNLCADRIEYNLQGGLLRGLLTPAEFKKILSDLQFSDNQWFFKEIESAKKLALCSLTMTETLWGAAWEGLAYRWAADALRYGFEIGLVSFDEFHFSNDQLVWNKMCESQDEKMRHFMHRITHVKEYFTLVDHGKEDLLLKLKFRGLDPYIKVGHDLTPLTQIDIDYETKFFKLKSIMEKGWAIKFVNL